MRLSFTVDIWSDPETVFSWIADPDMALIWMTSVAGGEIIDRRAGVVGTTFRGWVEEDEGGIEMLGSITAFEPNRRISFRLANLVNERDVEDRIDEVGGCVRLTATSDVRWKFPVNLVSPFVGRAVKRRIVDRSNEEFAWLKQLCEESQARQAF